MRRSMQVPGPGNYDNHEKLKMDPKGNYLFSKWRSSGAPVFSRSRRNTNLETSVTRKSKHWLSVLCSYAGPGNIPDALGVRVPGGDWELQLARIPQAQQPVTARDATP